MEVPFVDFCGGLGSALLIQFEFDYADGLTETCVCSVFGNMVVCRRVAVIISQRLHQFVCPMTGQVRQYYIFFRPKLCRQC